MVVLEYYATAIILWVIMCKGKEKGDGEEEGKGGGKMKMEGR